MPKLTIGIPTYKREFQLFNLISFLVKEFDDFDPHDIQIIVVDNDHLSGTNKKNLSKFISNGAIEYIQNHKNIGAVANVLKIYSLSSGRYLWIIGDDDLPTSSALSSTLSLINNMDPHLIYLPSKWVSELSKKETGTSVSNNNLNNVSKEKLLKKAHMYITFLSSWIVNKDILNENLSFDYLKYKDTMFPHLAWILELLKKDTNLYSTSEIGIIALGGNSGNYDVIRSFSQELPNILNNAFGIKSKESLFLMKSIFGYYLPPIIKNVRDGSLGSFMLQKTDLGSYPGNKLLSIYFGFLLKRMTVCGKIEAHFLTFFYRIFKLIHLKL